MRVSGSLRGRTPLTIRSATSAWMWWGRGAEAPPRAPPQKLTATSRVAWWGRWR
jgi:hypothetical protein